MKGSIPKTKVNLRAMCHSNDIVMRKFETRNFSVVASISPDDELDLSWDDSGEVRKKLASGEYEAFQVAVRVYYRGREISADYLGGSIYHDPRNFFTEHVGLAAKSRADGMNYGCYFPAMIGEAIKEARRHFAGAPKLRSVQ